MFNSVEETPAFSTPRTRTNQHYTSTERVTLLKDPNNEKNLRRRFPNWEKVRPKPMFSVETIDFGDKPETWKSYLWLSRTFLVFLQNEIQSSYLIWSQKPLSIFLISGSFAASFPNSVSWLSVRYSGRVISFPVLSQYPNLRSISPLCSSSVNFKIWITGDQVL